MQSERYLLRPSRIQIISDLGKGQCLFLKFMCLTRFGRNKVYHKKKEGNDGCNLNATYCVQVASKLSLIWEKVNVRF